MRKIYFATTNALKLEQAKSVFNNIFDIEGIKIDLEEIQTLDQELVSKHKAKQAFNILKEPVIVDDAGIFIKKYNNFPGVLTAHVSKGLGKENIFNLFNDGDEAEFRSVITYIDSENEITVSENMQGILVRKNMDKIDNKNIFGSLFKISQINKFMEELNNQELMEYSHRGKALKKLYDVINNLKK